MKGDGMKEIFRKEEKNKEETEKRNNHGKDPRTLEVNSQGTDPSTFESNSQEKVPSTCKRRGRQTERERWRLLKKRKKKEEKKEMVK